MDNLFSGTHCLEVLAWNWGPGDGRGASDLLKHVAQALLPGTERSKMAAFNGVSFLCEPQPPLLAYEVCAIRKLLAIYT